MILSPEGSSILLIWSFWLLHSRRYYQLLRTLVVVGPLDQTPSEEEFRSQILSILVVRRLGFAEKVLFSIASTILKLTKGNAASLSLNIPTLPQAYKTIFRFFYSFCILPHHQSSNAPCYIFFLTAQSSMILPWQMRMTVPWTPPRPRTLPPITRKM